MKKPVVKKIGADTKLGDAKKRMKKSTETYKIYINKMLKQVCNGVDRGVELLCFHHFH